MTPEPDSKVTHPLRRKLLLPLLVMGTAISALLVVLAYAQIHRLLQTNLLNRAELAAGLLGAAAANATGPGDLQTVATSLGHDPEIPAVFIVGGSSSHVLAASNPVWVGRPLAEVTSPTLASQIQANLAKRESNPEFFSDGPALARISPFALAPGPSAANGAPRAVVVVQLDTTPLHASLLRTTLAFSGALAAGLGLLVVLGNFLIKHYLLRSIERIGQAVTQGREATETVWSAATANDEFGALARTLCFSITRTDSALRDLENFKFALDQHTLVSVTDEHGRITYVNDRFCAVSGYSRPELIGQTHRLLHSGIHSDEFFKQLWDSIKTGEVWRAEICNRTKDGSLYWDDCTIVPLLGPTLEPDRYISIRSNITARKQFEAALTKERFLMQALMSSLPDYVYFKDLKSRLIRISQSMAAAFKLGSPDDAVGKTDFDFFTLEHARQAYEDEQTIIQTGQPITTEELVTWPDRPDTWSATIKMPLRDEKGTIIGTFGISRDITPRKQAEAALLEAKEAAESANRAKSDFLATMSHEIRTPMNVVLGFTDLLIETPLQTRQREYVGLIRTSGRNLIALINDILDFSKIEAGRLEVDKARVDAISVANKTVQVFAGQAQKKGLWLAVRSAPDLPRIVVADPNRLRQVLTNLIGNALKFTLQGGVTVTVAASPTDPTRFLRLTITDTGIGIPLEKQAVLFHKFTQADSSTTREFGGTGLGLAICKSLVELMSGSIGLQSSSGKGASFWCDLPMSSDQTPLEASAPAVPVPEVAPEVPLVPVAQGSQRRRVLVVDDNELNQQLVQSFLTKLGCDTVLANNGLEAFGYVQWQTFDLVIMDHQMPVMDGCESTRSIRNWEREQGRKERLPIIAVTANAAPNSKSFYLAAGMDGYLAKPVTRPALAQAINVVLGLAGGSAAASGSDEIVASQSISPNRLMDHSRALDRVDQNPTLLALLGKAFAAQSEELITGLTQAIAAHDGPALKQQAHKLKGSVGNFAADSVWAAAKALEDAASAPEWTWIEPAGARLVADIRQLRTELAELPPPVSV